MVELKEVLASRQQIFMVMELVHGGELFDKIIAEGPMSVGFYIKHQQISEVCKSSMSLALIIKQLWSKRSKAYTCILSLKGALICYTIH